MSESIYFYSIAQPLEGVLGSATISNGEFTEVTGLAKIFIDSISKRYTVENAGQKHISDQETFDILSNNWTNGAIFTLPKLFTGEQIKEYVG